MQRVGLLSSRKNVRDTGHLEHGNLDGMDAGEALVEKIVMSVYDVARYG